MKKKTLYLLLILLVATLLLMLGSTKVNAFEVTEGDYVYSIAEDNTATIAEYNGSNTIVNIPGETNDGYTVVAIGEEVFSLAQNRNNIIEVNMPDSIETIEFGVFSGCKNLANIELSENLKTIEGYAFSGCESLTEITIPESVKTIEDNVLSGCINLELVEIKGIQTRTESQTFNGIDRNFILKCIKYSNAYIEYDNDKVQIETEKIYMKASKMLLSYSISSGTYTGEEIVLNNLVVKEIDETVLTAETDYEINYENNINVGTATAKITGMGKYIGEIDLEYSINPKDIILALDSNSIHYKEYTGSEIIQDYQFYDNGMVLNRDYTVEYENNINAGLATIRIAGLGNYSGTAEIPFNILPKKIVDDNISIDLKDQIYTGKELTTTISVKDGEKILAEGTDYTIVYENNINAGTAKVTITGTGNYKETFEKEFKIVPKKLSAITATVNTKNKTYTGKAIKTSIVLKNGSVTLKEGTDYTVAYKNNKNTGKATVTITGKGNYTGTITKTFKIVPKKAKITSVKNSKKKTAKITWEKDKQATGYVIYMATSKNGEYKKIKTIKSNKTVTYSKAKLTKSKKYYFKVRSYKTIDDQKAYGSYSSKKSVTIKK